MLGVRPVPDSLGRVNQIEPVPLEELGRPRIDVVVTCSGVFRPLLRFSLCLVLDGLQHTRDSGFIKSASELIAPIGEQLSSTASRPVGTMPRSLGPVECRFFELTMK